MQRRIEKLVNTLWVSCNYELRNLLTHCGFLATKNWETCSHNMGFLRRCNEKRFFLPQCGLLSVNYIHSSSQFLIKSFLLLVECTQFLLRVPEVLVFTTHFQCPPHREETVPPLQRRFKDILTSLLHNPTKHTQSTVGGQKAHSAVLKYGECVTSLVF